MADRWMDERDRQMRERDWRRSEQYGRGGEQRREDYGADRSGEDRSWRSDDDSYGEPGGYQDQGRDRVFGERETGASYGRQGGSSGGGYGGGNRYGQPMGRQGGYSGGSYPGAGYQASGYQGPGYRGQAPRMSSQDYTQGGRYYGDDTRERIYPEEYGERGGDYGDVPMGYDTRRGQGGGYQRSSAYDSGYQTRRPASGGTGGYDYERGYGDGGRRDYRGDRDREGRRDERQGGPAEFLQRAGERLSSWFGGGDQRREWRADDRDEMRDRGLRGLGPKGYKRPDERISEEVHERLTDDTWLDASGIIVSVSAAEVTLSGTVPNRESKHRAERIVEEISGVEHVQNNLRVDKGGFFTRAAPGYGDSVMEAQMREGDTSARPAGGSASGASSTSTSSSPGSSTSGSASSSPGGSTSGSTSKKPS